MPIPWRTMLKVVPWGDVIGNAPKVADGAKKLWNAVGKKPVPEEVPQTPPPSELSPESRAIVALQGQASALETAVAELHAQMLASSELIQALAEQNTQLVARVEAHRVTVRWLTAALALIGLLAVAALAVALVR